MVGIKNNSNNWQLFFIVLTWLLVHVFLYQSKGLLIITDSKAYIREADHLLKYGLFEHPFRLLYASYILLIAFVRLLTKEPIVLAVFQSFISLCAVIIMYNKAAHLFKNSTASFLSAVFFLTWWDCILWDMAILTESLFCSLILLLLAFLCTYNGTKKSILIVSFLIFLILLTRPSGVIILMGCLAYFIYNYKKEIRLLDYKKKLIGILILCFLGVGGATALFQHWDFSENYKIGNIITYMDTLKGSPLYVKNLHIPLSKEEISQLEEHSLGILNMADFFVQHPLYTIKTGFLKVFYLLTFYRPYYSATHNLYNVFWLIVIYGSFIFGLIKSKKHPLKAFVMTVIVGNCFLIAISAADWDNRFFIPMEPGIILFSGYGLWYFTNVVKTSIIYN